MPARPRRPAVNAMRWRGRFEVITFDCYGTLIDWEAGLLAAFKPILARHAVKASDEKVLRLWARFEKAEESGPWRPYREVMRWVVLHAGMALGFRPSPSECDSVLRSLGGWPAFPDTVAALRRLKRRYGLGVISNIDDALFAKTAKTLRVPFDWVVTAEQARSYKPAKKNFELALRRIGLPKGRILHAAQSRFHDIRTAKALGLATVWVNRRHAQKGGGATPGAAVTPDWVVPNLKTLADRLA